MPRLSAAAFLPASLALRWVGGLYLLVLGLALLVLPPGPQTSPVDSEFRGAATALGGLALLWIAVLSPRRRGALVLSATVTLPQLWFAIDFLRQGVVPGAATLGLLAAALLATAVLPAPTDDRPRPDALGLAFGAAQAIQGASFLVAPDSAGPIPAAVGLPAPVCGAILLAGGAAVVAAQLRPQWPSSVRRGAHLLGGGVVLAIWAAVGLRIDEAYFFLGAATLVRGASIAALPWLSDRLVRFDGRALAPRLGLGFATAGLAPLFAALPLVLDATVGRAGEPDVRRAVFGGALVLMVLSGWTAWWLAARLAAPLADLVRTVEKVASGERAAELPPVGVSEVDRLGQAVEAMAATIEAREASLEGRRREFETLIEHAPYIVARFDRDLRHLYVNAAVEAATGIPAAAFPGKTTAELWMPPELAAVWDDQCRVALASGEEQRCEFSFAGPNGLRHYWARLVPEPGADGRPESLLAVISDVTERKQAEEAQRRSESIYRRLAEANLFGVGFGSSTGGVSYVNDEMLRMMGRTRADFEAGRIDWFAAIAPEYRERIAAEAARLLRDGSASGYEAAFLRPDGGLTHYVAAAALVEPGEDFHVSIALDLTAIKATESALRESEARFRTMADETPIVIWTADAAGGIEFVNQAYREFFGVTEEEARGSNWQPLVHPEDAPAYVGAFMAALKRRAPFQAEARVRRADGAWRWVESVGAPRFAADGAFIGMVGSSPDVTERKLAEEDRATLLAALAHDVKNPLGAVKGQAQLMRRRLGRDDVALDRLESGCDEIAAAVDRATALIDEMLDAARLRASRPLDLRLETFDLVALAETVVGTVQPDAVAPRARIAAAVPALVGVWDRQRLERVLANLLSNAVKYSPDGGEVLVTVWREDDAAGVWAALSVSDRGVGIPAADLTRLFQRFRRGGNVGAIGGFGIGLAGARQIVEQHGGTITAASVEGEGSTFTVRLPLGGPPR